ncbi:uncharacterized protein HKW66_Vig0147170 [Vigna angularis]|uniref:Zinc-finger domain-containing protein n=1 Tax=Phaseolus angularis TaxID=3914 RepID=A0A8T0JV26_PHAAN|nr:uncharacterized protein HKW66_Vig0147170 [Vigna angularis]
MKIQDETATLPEENWFVYGLPEKDEIDKYISSRYGENAEEVAQLANWTCRGICNCSLCQKRRGEQPTGPLYRSAKESGFKSVAEMLAMKKNLETSNPLNEGNLIKEPEVFLSEELGNENFSDANVTAVCTKDDGGENFGMNIESKAIAEEILLPPGMELKEIFGIQLPPKEVGDALQILEFCRVFGKVSVEFSFVFGLKGPSLL